MKLPESNIKTESFGVKSTTSFGISEDDVGILLNILRTKIYKNPILAVCREISCNARDAHREVHEDATNPTTQSTPIEVYLPNNIEPTLKIRDFGPGISPHRKDIFVKFGKSTKRDSNLQTGGFGLGCKTPFAYGQSFTVDTVCDIPSYTYKCLADNSGKHMRFVYHAYIDETQVGAMDLVHMEATDDPKGTSIILPVKKEDFFSFENVIIQCTKHWAVKPKLYGGNSNHRPEYPHLEELYRGDGWVMYTEGITYPCAIVDGIEYPIDRTSLGGRSDLQNQMLNYGFCMEFGVGELSLTANRDHLHYDEETTKKILDRLNVIAGEIRAKIEASINEAPSYFAAIDTYRKVKNNIDGIIRNMRQLEWNGHKLRATCQISDIGKWAKVVGYSANNEQVLVNRHNDVLYVNDPKVLIIHNDKTTHLNKRVVLWLLEKHPDVKTIQAIYTPDQPTSASYKEAVEQYGSDHANADVKYDMELLELIQPVKYSELQIPKPKYLPKPKDARGRVILEDGNINGYKLKVEYGGRYSSKRDSRYKIAYVPSQFPRDEGGVFVVFDYKTGTVSSEGKKIDVELFNKLSSQVGGDIIGLSPKRAEMIADDDAWVSLTQALRNVLQPYIDKCSVDDLNTLIKSTWFTFEYRCGFSSIRNYIGDIEDPKSPLIQWIEESDLLMTALKEFKPMFWLYKWLGYDLNSICDSFVSSYNPYADFDAGKLPKLSLKVMERYPLLNVDSHSAYRLSVNHEFLRELVSYVNMVDKLYEETHVTSILTELSKKQESTAVAAGN